MKPVFYKALAGILFIAGLFSACTPELDSYKGSYSFKTSGMLTLWDHGNTANDSIAGIADTLLQSLTSEAGQMNIAVRDKSKNTMVITMNIMGGDAVSFTAKATEEALVLEPKQRNITLQLLDRIPKRIQVVVDGEGRRYGDVLLFKLNYSGSVTEAGVDYEIIESKVECVAELNK